MMKKVMLASGLALVAPLASADFLGVYAGVGQWQSDYDGQVGDRNNDIGVEQLGLDDSGNNFVYLAFEHPVPILPNARIQYTDINTRQSATLTESFSLDGQQFNVSETIDSDVDLTHVDFTLYYELLDNWVNLDLGLTARQFDGYVQAQGELEQQRSELDEVIPMIYGKARFDLPLTGLYAGVEANIINYDDNSLSDTNAHLGYYFVDSMLVDVGIEVGYRQMQLEIEDDVTADVDLTGPYAALTVHF